MKAVGILHQEFAPAHHPETRPDFVAELGLNLVEVHRQLAITADIAAHQIGDDFFMRRPEHELALVTILQPQQLGTVLRVAAGFLPQLGRHHHWRQQFQGTGAIHFLAHDRLDLPQHAQPQRQPGVDAGGELADHACTQHQPVADDFGVGGDFLERG